jgi:hypothetical protein
LVPEVTLIAFPIPAADRAAGLAFHAGATRPATTKRNEFNQLWQSPAKAWKGKSENSRRFGIVAGLSGRADRRNETSGQETIGSRADIPMTSVRI